MTGLARLNLIHFLDFYFVLMIIVGTMRRIGQYREVGRLVMAGRSRWPGLLHLVNQHRTIFLTWATVLPGFFALVLSVTQLFASRYVFPHANLSVGSLGEMWLASAIVALLGAVMVGVDGYCAFAVGQFDRREMEKYFDQAEYWLKSKTAHVVRIVTFGYVNPREMVGVEVRKALVEASELLQVSLWWITVQVGVRVVFGLTLWGTWLVTGEPAA